MTKSLVALILIALAGSADAALTSRLSGQAVYDSDLDITWLANANAGAGSAFDNGSSNTDGLMTWTNAGAWAASLTVGGFTGWRLPTTLNPDPTCASPSDSSGFNCSGSEMGHLFYNELGGTVGVSILSSGDPDLPLFTNVQPSAYWSSTEVGISKFDAYFFDFRGGSQSAITKGASEFAWAVRDGDVATVPVPAAAWLFGSALGLLGWMRRKNI